MTPRTQKSNRDVRQKLRTDSFVIYERVMFELFQHYESYDFVKTLGGYFRSKRYDLALRLADSMSEHKHSDATTHFVANQFAQLIRKYPWDPKVVGTDPESQAIGSFLRSERKCSLLNRKFRLLDSRRDPYCSDLQKMRDFIRFVLDDSPNLEKIFSSCAFGAGASVGVHGNATNLARKVLADKWSVSPGAFTYGYWAVMRDPHIRDLLLDSRSYISCLDWGTSKSAYSQKAKLVNYNKISFVPKTAKTHRAIAVEPLLNGYLQKGIDTIMRIRMKRIGINLEDQSLNQRLARQGSVDDSEESFVTIDLSSASDSISEGLVRSLLPPEWFDLLNSTRSHRYELRGKIYSYHKFCSMGNGFCFPLETLLFAACCSAVGCGVPGTDFSVYGDDIIVRRKHAGGVLRLLKVLGFSPNPNKTFIEGPFRESCGADWFGGVDVRPYTLDYELGSIESLFKWLNLTRRSQLTTDFFSGTWSMILDQIPHRFRFFRPFKGNADSGIDAWADQHLTSPTCFFDRRNCVWVCKELVHTTTYDSWGMDSYRRDSVDMYALLSGLQSVKHRVGYSFRRKTKTTTTRKVSSSATSSWLPY
ncbi:RNA-directed RNA polymerase [ssRNA phage Gerhypos.1_51]|uniref:RNA-directed RNA polymerase n=2 Tax=Norzivirales TaxID=2842247 RepID=A0A8S5L086_9VIRU|nr:RNA-directed RNA polymerase [ssRNA phage Gerhypos.1_51]QDH90196.1 MAG: RNA-dependent RNA polymerase [Leviviridae sp.]DAD51350.1 TPA_asm: RNA-directed RNA polymerase [ssRNA phage Gerhypos.1_51]